MSADEQILKILKYLQADVTAMKGDVGKIPAIEKRLGTLETGQQALQANVKDLHGKIDTVELKVEAIHEYQKQAHDEIMEHLIESNEITGKDQQKLEKRIERIEKHLGLPPLK